MDVGEIQTHGEKFRKRVIVVETGDGKWANPLPCDVVNKEIETLPDLMPGDLVEARYAVRGREYKGRYYIDLRTDGWKIVKPADRTAEQPEEQAQDRAEDLASEGTEAALPF